MHHRKLRIVNIMFSTSDQPFGSEKVAYKYTEMFLKDGHDVFFIHRHDYDRDYMDVAHEHLTCLQIKTRHMMDLLLVRRRIKKFKPDVIIVHNHFSRFRMVGKWIAPMVGVAHLGKFSSLRSYEGAIAFRSDLVDLAVQQGLSRASVGLVPNTTDFPVLPTPEPFKKPPVIGAVGRLSGEKNFGTFIRALSILNEKSVQFSAVLAGSGALESQLKEQAKADGVDHLLEFKGFVTHVVDFYQQIDICCVPSLEESFGVVMLEAMAAKKPIVASRIPSFRLLLNEGESGLLFDTMDSKSLATAIQALIEDPVQAKEYGERAAKAYENRYSEKVVYHQLDLFLRRFSDEVV